MKTLVMALCGIVSLSALAFAQVPKEEQSFHSELSDLREELKSLRSDIQSLAQLLKPSTKQPADTTGNEGTDHTLVSDAIVNSTKISMPSKLTNEKCELRLEREEVECINLSLESCVQMALANSHIRDNPKLSGSTRLDTLYQTKIAFWKLWGAHREWEVYVQRHVNTLVNFNSCQNSELFPRKVVPVLEAWAVNNLPSKRFGSPGGPKLSSNLLLRLENDLRAKIGWAANSGHEPVVYPVVDKVDAAQWPDSWEVTKFRALEFNPGIQQIRSELSEAREGLKRHQSQSESDDFAKQLGTLREKLVYQESNLTAELSRSWRRLQEYREKARISKEQRDAFAEEVHFFLGSQDWASDSILQNLDSLHRAQERHDGSMREHHKQVEEMHKAAARLEYLCGETN